MVGVEVEAEGGGVVGWRVARVKVGEAVRLRCSRKGARQGARVGGILGLVSGGVVVWGVVVVVVAGVGVGEEVGNGGLIANSLVEGEEW